MFKYCAPSRKMLHNLCHYSTKHASKFNVGFIGLGNMGKNMAANLLKGGNKLAVYDISKSAVAAITAQGAKGCDSPAEVAAKSDYIITMLPNNDIVFNCYAELAKSGKKGGLYIDSSTIDPLVSKQVKEIICTNGGRFCDAPVSGGVPGAENATLTFMVGGENADVEAARPVLEYMGAKVTHCGNIGMGQAAKICNNMLLAISMIGVSECMNLGIRLGLDAKTLMDIVNSSTGRCWSSEIYNPVPNMIATAPASNKYQGGFATKLMHKDLGLAMGVATKSLTPIPLGALSHQLYSTIMAHGLGDKDFSIIYDFLQDKPATKS